MDSALFLQIVTVVSDLIIFVFVGFYFWTMQKDRKILEERQKRLKQKSDEIEAKYDQIVDEAHDEKKKILQKTSQKANAIISDTQFVTDTSKKIVEDALQKLSVDIKAKAQAASNQQVDTYKNYLDRASKESLNDFSSVADKFAHEMEKQTQQFRTQLLKNMQKELEEFKVKKMQAAEQKINIIVDKVAQKVLGKSISPQDHKKLILDSLEKAQKEGVFD
jgi:F-type H+-transporting ATPase subunit b